MSDDAISDLLVRVAAQDRAAFAALYSASAAKLMGVTFRILGNRAEAEEAVQEVFTRVWLRAGRFDASKARGMTWLIAIARNHAIDRIRARPDAQFDGDDALLTVADTTPSAEATLSAKGDARRIADCFDTLDPDRAAAVKGAYLNGLSYQDLAARFSVPLNTMRTWLRRSLLSLKDCLES